MTLLHDIACIESDRLLLRRITPADFEYYATLHADPEVSLYLGHGKPRPREESSHWMTMIQRTYAQLALGQLAVVLKSENRLIGRCGLNDFIVENIGGVPRGWFDATQVPADVDVRHEYELGYTFERSSWGFGYASEAARCALDYARNQRRVPRIVSLIHPDNTRSRRLAERLGAQRESTARVADRPFDLYVLPA